MTDAEREILESSIAEQMSAWAKERAASKILREALEYYADHETAYFYPKLWNCAKEGGLPSVEDCDSIEDLGATAREALAAADSITSDKTGVGL